MEQRQASPDEEFTEFVLGVYGQLVRTARLMLGDHQQAEDFAQAALERVYLRWNRSATWESPHAYARKVLVNQVLKSFRRRASSEVVQAEVGDVATGEDLADLHAGRRDLEIAFRRLPLEQRAVLTLRYYEDLSVEQTAQAIGCSLGTVKSRTNRALATLRSSGVLREYAPEERQEP